MRQSETVLFGIAIGAGLMYLLDPDRGARRRALLRDQLIRAGHDLEEVTATSARRVRNRAVGLAHEAHADLTEGDVDDRVLVERVRSEIGRVVSNPHAVEVESSRGHITLAGNVGADELHRLVRTVKAVRGVESVENHLHAAPNSPGDRDANRRG
jgi:osmotically-inducible protein OsmY